MDVPEGTINEVLEWVGDDPQRAQAALDAEYDGQNRTTLIAQLQAIAEQEDAPMSDEPATVEPELESEEIPAPEPRTELVLDAIDAGVAISPVHLSNPEVEPSRDLRPEREDGEEVEEQPIEGAMVETLQAAHASHGMILAINGEPFAFTAQMAATLKGIVDKAIVGLAL